MVFLRWRFIKKHSCGHSCVLYGTTETDKEHFICSRAAVSFWEKHAPWTCLTLLWGPVIGSSFLTSCFFHSKWSGCISDTSEAEHLLSHRVHAFILNQNFFTPFVLIGQLGLFLLQGLSFNRLVAGDTWCLWSFLVRSTFMELFLTIGSRPCIVWSQLKVRAVMPPITVFWSLSRSVSRHPTGAHCFRAARLFCSVSSYDSL